MGEKQTVETEGTGPLQKRVSALIKAQMQKRDVQRALTNCAVCGTHLSTKSREEDSAFTCSSSCTTSLADDLKQLGQLDDRSIPGLIDENKELSEQTEELGAEIEALEQAKREGWAIDYCAECGIFLRNHPREDGDSTFTCSSRCTSKLADILKEISKEGIDGLQKDARTLKKTRAAIKPIIDNCLVCDDDLCGLALEDTEDNEVPKESSSPITCSKKCTEIMRRVVEEYKETLVAMLKQNGQVPEDLEEISLEDLLELAEEPNKKKE